MNRWVKAVGVVAVAGIMTAGGVAYGAGNSTSTIYGCVDQQGNVRVISAKDTCRYRETALNWNQQGQQGSMGPAGPQGAPGKDGVGGVVPVENSTVVGQATFEGIEGGDPGAPSFDIVSYAFESKNVRAGGTGSGSGQGKSELGEIAFAKRVDKASPLLFRYVAQGKAVPKVTVSIYKPGTTTVNYKFELNEVFVTKLLTRHDGAQSSVPLEDVSVSYAKLKETYTTVDGTNISTTVDLKTTEVS